MGSVAGLTGWSEDFILWELPLERGLRYQHVALLKAGVITVQTEDSQIAELEEITKELINGGTENTGQPG